MINTISTNVTSTVPINPNEKKVRYKTDCYTLHMSLLVIILLFIHYRYYLLSLCKS